MSEQSLENYANERFWSRQLNRRRSQIKVIHDSVRTHFSQSECAQIPSNETQLKHSFRRIITNTAEKTKTMLKQTMTT